MLSLAVRQRNSASGDLANACESGESRSLMKRDNAVLSEPLFSD
jgi:hypothetical protein